MCSWSGRVCLVATQQVERLDGGGQRRVGVVFRDKARGMAHTPAGHQVNLGRRHFFIFTDESCKKLFKVWGATLVA